jgi:hypothetical protein
VHVLQATDQPLDSVTAFWQYLTVLSSGQLTHSAQTFDLVTQVSVSLRQQRRTRVQYILGYTPALYGAELAIDQTFPSCQTPVTLNLPLGENVDRMLITVDGPSAPALTVTAPDGLSTGAHAVHAPRHERQL